MSGGCIDFVLGTFALGTVIFWIIALCFFAETFVEHVRANLAFTLETKRAEHRAKLKMIEGLDR